MPEGLEVPDLESERLVMEPLSYDHADGMFALWSSPEVCRFAGPAKDLGGDPIALPAPTRSESDKLIEFWSARRLEGSGFRWAILLKPSQRFVGAAGFNSLGSCAEYAYHLHPDYWGQGLMLEASRLALSWLASRGDCEASEVFVEPDNVRSARLAKRLGFQLIGRSADGTDRYLRPC